MEMRGVRRGVPWVLLSTLLVVLTVTVWRTHERLHQIDYRPEVALYKHIGEKIGRRFKVVALTEDYGYRLAYWGWLNARVWPSYGDLSYQEKLGRSTSDFEKRFSKLTAGMDYFVVTWPEELELQPLLKEHLFRNFLLYEQGGDYLIFDLSKPSAWTEKPAYLAYLS